VLAQHASSMQAIATNLYTLRASNSIQHLTPPDYQNPATSELLSLSIRHIFNNFSLKLLHLSAGSISCYLETLHWDGSIRRDGSWWTDSHLLYMLRFIIYNGLDLLARPSKTLR
jgi:hypothetical protein